MHKKPHELYPQPPEILGLPPLPELPLGYVAWKYLGNGRTEHKNKDGRYGIREIVEYPPHEYPFVISYGEPHVFCEGWSDGQYDGNTPDFVYCIPISKERYERDLKRIELLTILSMSKESTGIYGTVSTAQPNLDNIVPGHNPGKATWALMKEPEPNNGWCRLLSVKEIEWCRKNKLQKSGSARVMDTGKTWWYYKGQWHDAAIGLCAWQKEFTYKTTLPHEFFTDSGMPQKTQKSDSPREIKKSEVLATGFDYTEDAYLGARFAFVVAGVIGDSIQEWKAMLYVKSLELIEPHLPINSTLRRRPDDEGGGWVCSAYDSLGAGRTPALAACRALLHHKLSAEPSKSQPVKQDPFGFNEAKEAQKKAAAAQAALAAARAAKPTKKKPSLTALDSKVIQAIEALEFSHNLWWDSVKKPTGIKEGNKTTEKIP